ncbi:peptide-methionine (R)-S-oxide reductase MsrB [Pontibacter silvestris]|uniref:peptide-methionine (R)-S-oxide reductase n=1 Tax=Pontibacter silvestris TaxID=2305183 RepID=A0ABW4WZG7_9BACT|nr:peptide-methionine (R)-S-oxide reductase MsrB [Pontibacter silvestris]MCC9135455.1 peptide-methionine (R)-S-oxide reductase MsrB [Pontibacter silvestris]
MERIILVFTLAAFVLLGCQNKPEAKEYQGTLKENSSTVTNGKNNLQKENPYYSRTDTTKLDLPDEVWKKVLSEDVYQVARGKATERAFTGKYWNYTGVGTYYCAACGNALFRSDAKFASDCGWPSFFETIRKNGVVYETDTTYGMVRTEVLCGRCDAHLGHLFDDGPPPTGKRFCMNSLVLDFEPGKHLGFE